MSRAALVLCFKEHYSFLYVLSNGPQPFNLRSVLNPCTLAGAIAIPLVRNVAPEHAFLMTACLVHAGSMFATSFVEEEHQTVYFTVSTLHFVQTLSSLRRGDAGGALYPLALLACARVLRSYNQVKRDTCVLGLTQSCL